MHKLLRTRLWAATGGILSQSLELSSSDKSLKWRLFRCGSKPRLFVVVELHDFAGGGFNFFPGISHGKFPKAADIPQSQSDAVIEQRGYAYLGDVRTAGLAAYCGVSVEMEWLTPSAELVRAALETADGAELLNGLGVTATTNHHMLSHGILEALGIEISDADFDLVVANFSAALERIANGDLRDALRKLSDPD